jgi:hypothetical protein
VFARASVSLVSHPWPVRTLTRENC